MNAQLVIHGHDSRRLGADAAIEYDCDSFFGRMLPGVEDSREKIRRARQRRAYTVLSLASAIEGRSVTKSIAAIVCYCCCGMVLENTVSIPASSFEYLEPLDVPIIALGLEDA